MGNIKCFISDRKGIRIIGERKMEEKKRKKILANRVYSDSTLKSWTKEQLIEQIRILEHNWACAEESFNNSVKNSDKIFAEQKAEIERLTKKAEEAKFWEKDYLEWATGFLKTRFDIKDWFTNPETQRPPCTYEFFASTLWEKIRPAMEWLDELKERNEALRKENAELQKQVDELKELNARYLDSIESVQAGRCRLRCELTQQAVKDTAKEIYAMFDDRNYISESELKKAIAERYGVEVE